MVQQLLSAGFTLSSIWEKARARDRQREVAGDKGQWASSTRDETSYGSGCRMVARGSSYHSPIFCFLKREGEEKGWVLGCSLILWLLSASGECCMGQDPQAPVSWGWWAS
jgi:hypothetical protein